jgi:hypothetical protein
MSQRVEATGWEKGCRGNDKDEVRIEVGVRMEVRIETEIEMRAEVRMMVEPVLSMYLVEIKN